jgi:Cofilin/tropomyosin-type actin-binding protein
LCRSPDSAKIKDKMVTASSRDALRRSLVGIAIEIQGTDYSEVAYETGASFSFLFHSLAYHLIYTSPVLDKAKRGN